MCVNHSLEVGDIVKLKGDAREMMITTLGGKEALLDESKKYNGKVTCKWVENEEWTYRDFHVDELEFVRTSHGVNVEKKQGIFLFILCLLFGLNGVNAKEYDFEVDGIYYNILSAIDKNLEVTFGEKSYSGNIVIPQNVTYENITFTVTTIGQKAFYKSLIETIELPSSISAIEESAFYHCKQLKECNFPNSLKTIGTYAFVNTQIESIIMPSSVSSIGTYAFQGCMVKRLEFAEGISTISHMAFTSCDSLETIVFPSTLKLIKAAAFDNCPNIKVVISKSTTSPRMYDSYWFSGGRGTHTLYNPFTYSDSDSKPIYVLLVPKGSKQSYYNETTKEDGKKAWPVATIEEFDEHTDYSMIGTELICGGWKYVITNSGNVNHSQLVCNTESTDVEKLDIPNNITLNQKEYSVESINPNYISAYSSLRFVSINKNEPISIEEGTFNANTALFGTLHVPTGTSELYKSAKVWKDFTNIMDDYEIINNTYILTYMLDGEAYYIDTLVYGESINLPDMPTKEGHTFSGWSEVPETMPAKDVTVTGSFTVNSYTLLYTVDGAEYKKVELEYGTSITAEAEPAKEGHTFSGWSEIPATMPAQDVAVEGTFIVNRYKITYVVDGEEYASDSIAYGKAIVLKDVPVKDGYVFSGWSEVPETMPAQDMTVTGSFTVNGINAVVSDKFVDVYTLQGVMVKRQILLNELKDELPKGLYIVNGKKMVIR